MYQDAFTQGPRWFIALAIFSKMTQLARGMMQMNWLYKTMSFASHLDELSLLGPKGSILPYCLNCPNLRPTQLKNGPNVCPRTLFT